MATSGQSDDKHLAALRTYWKQAKAFPSMGKLCDVLGLSSTSSVFAAVGRLTEAGYLERVEGRIAPTRKFFARPVLGQMKAGLPEPAPHDGPDEVLTLDDYLIDDPNRTVLVRIKGDSMADVGILDGDLAVVEANAPTSPGDVVAALVDEERTVKHLRRDRRGFYLQAANAAKAYPEIRPKTSLEILGVVIGVVRRMRK